MNQGRDLYNTKEQITDLGIKESNIKVVPKGTVLFSFKLSIGKIGITQREMYTNEAIAAFPIIDERILCENYLLYALTRIDATKTTDRAVMGATLNKRKLAELKIPLPSLEEQQRIAAILDKADAIRRKRQQAIELTDQLLRSIFLDMFGDPVTNPKGWTKSKFGEVTQSRLGKMLDAKQQTGLHQYFYLRNPNVQWGKIVLNELKTMDFDEKDQQEFSLKNGDVLICEGGEVGRAAIWREDMEHCYFQKALHRVRPNKDVVNSEYICDLMWFMAKHGGLKNYVSSATIAHLTGAKIKSMEIPIPPINLQNKYAAYVNKYQESINVLEKSQDAIGELLGSITRRAFCGELTKQTKAA